MQKRFMRPPLQNVAERPRARWLEWIAIASVIALLASEIVPLGLYFASNASFVNDVEKMHVAK